MKTSFSPDTRMIKLGGAITLSIEKLTNLKAEIMKLDFGDRMMRLIQEFKKEHDHFMGLSN